MLGGKECMYRVGGGGAAVQRTCTSPTHLVRVPSHTVNVDIFSCINFRVFLEIGNFACIGIRVFSTSVSLGYNKCNFHCVHIFADILETRIKRKYVLRENFYVYSMSVWGERSRQIIETSFWLLIRMQTLFNYSSLHSAPSVSSLPLLWIHHTKHLKKRHALLLM